MNRFVYKMTENDTSECVNCVTCIFVRPIRSTWFKTGWNSRWCKTDLRVWWETLFSKCSLISFGSVFIAVCLIETKHKHLMFCYESIASVLIRDAASSMTRLQIACWRSRTVPIPPTQNYHHFVSLITVSLGAYVKRLFRCFIYDSSDMTSC